MRSSRGGDHVNDVVTTTGARQPGRWSRLASLGLLMAAVGPLLMFLAGLIWGLDISEHAVFFIGTSVVALLGAFIVVRFDAVWAKIVGAVASFLVGGALF